MNFYKLFMIHFHKFITPLLQLFFLVEQFLILYLISNFLKISLTMQENFILHWSKYNKMPTCQVKNIMYVYMQYFSILIYLLHILMYNIHIIYNILHKIKPWNLPTFRISKNHTIPNNKSYRKLSRLISTKYLSKIP